MEEKSKCPACSKTEFEVVNEKPTNSNYELIFIRCSACKVVISVIDYYNLGTLIKKLAAKLSIDLDK